LFIWTFVLQLLFHMLFCRQLNFFLFCNLSLKSFLCSTQPLAPQIELLFADIVR